MIGPSHRAFTSDTLLGKARSLQICYDSIPYGYGLRIYNGFVPITLKGPQETGRGGVQILWEDAAGTVESLLRQADAHPF